MNLMRRVIFDSLSFICLWLRSACARLSNNRDVAKIKVGTHLATSCSNTLQRQVAATNRVVCAGNFCGNLCLCNIILSLQQVAKNQIRQNLCDLLLRQNSVAETNIFTKILLHTRRDLSLRRVAVTCCCK